MDRAPVEVGRARVDAEREMLGAPKLGPEVVRSSAAVPTPAALIGIVTDMR